MLLIRHMACTMGARMGRGSTSRHASADRPVCAHCRAPIVGPAVMGAHATASSAVAVDGARRATGAAELFCCTGCRSARELIGVTGLEHYYDLTSGPMNRGEADPTELPWLPALLEAARARYPSDRLVLTVDVQGLHCAACVWVMQALFSRLPGAHHLEIDPGVGRLRLTFDADRFALERYLQDLARLGYRTGPPCRTARAPSDGLGVRLGVTIAIAMNAMALSLATYLGLEPGDPDGLYTLFGWVNLALSTLAVITAGPVFIRGAVVAISRGTLHLDVPIALGVVLAFGGSVALFFGGHPELAYFDTLDIFLALMLLGRWAQTRLLDRNRRLLLDDDGFSHVRAKVIGDDGRIEHRPLAEVAPGMRLLVAPRELIPVAATLEGPAAELDLAWITGESQPLAFEPGAAVPAGAHLASASARVLRATQGFASSELGELLRAPRGDEAAAERAGGSDRFWHRFTAIWVVAVLAFAAIVAAAWWAHSPLEALRNATAVLVVTCPCAIGLATPLAYELAHLGLRKAGLLPRRPSLLDRVRGIRHVVFDKTGTLTLTRLGLDAASRRALDDLEAADRDALFQLTARSNHPKSRALQDVLPPVALDPSIDVTEVPGLGLSSATHTLHGDAQALVFARGGHPLARLAFEETLRPSAREEIAALTRLGLDVHIATGDLPERAARVASALGIAEHQVHARLSPSDKAALVERLGPARTLFMGDGVNDALAFDLACVAGTPVLDRPTLPARSDFVVTSGQLGPIADLVRLARRVRTITMRNVAIALVYNLIALVAGLEGWLSPVIAAVAMPASSLLVLTLTALSSRERRARPAVQPETGTELWMPST